ncbi:MAG TPA: hypothetical protein VIG33_08080 [Pseudobdellovibrionaceae bacterium]|jgi:hypothetical protein
MKFRLGMTILSFSFMAIAFQNCSKTHFTSDESEMYFKAETVAPDVPLPSNGGGDDGSQPVETMPPQTMATPAPNPTPADIPQLPPVTDPVAGPVMDPGTTPGMEPSKDHGKCDNSSSHDQAGHKDDKGHKGDAVAGLVECELGSPSLKIKLNQDFDAEHSNSQSSRVCMTENACLKVLNTYAADRKCSMDLGTPYSSGSPAQCTKIFPGSKGTCHNAKVLSDDAIKAILEKMGK